MNKSWYVYILECNKSYLYTGITTDIKRRIWEHSNGLGAKSLRGRKPIRLVYFEKCDSQREAAKKEALIKNWKREDKIKLINSKVLNFNQFIP